jgi:lipoprotein-releasing system permease protein
MLARPEETAASPASEPAHPGSVRLTPTGRRLPKRFHGGAFLLVQVAAVVAVALGWVVRQLLHHRLELGGDAALGVAVAAGALVAALGGFPAGRIGRKLCLLEHFIAFLVVSALLTGVILALALAPGAPSEILGSTPAGPAIGYGLAAAFGVLVFGFTGSSVGFLFGGGGVLDTRFSYEKFIARRHLMAKKRNSFLSVITVISVLAVAVGVWCLTVVLSVMSGFETDLRSKILGTHAHAVVLKYATAFEEHERVAEDVRGVRGVTGVSPFLLGQVMLTTEGQVEGVVIKGIVPESVGEVTELPDDVTDGDLEHLTRPEEIRPLTRQLEGEGGGILVPRGGRREEPVRPEGAPALPGIAIGKELSRSLRVFVGDRINVISPLSEEMGPTGPIPRSRSFRVAAVFYTGMYEYDSKFAYIHLNEAQRFFDMPGAVTGLEVRTNNLDEAHAIARRIETRLEGYPYYAKHWGEMHRNLFAALKLEKLVMAIILAFIILVASFVILATLIMMVMEKGKDIAILKSMGARDSSIMKIFVVEGLSVAVVGTALGLVLGLGTCAFIASGIIQLDPGIYYINTLPVQVEPLQLVLVCVVAILLSYLATIYPSVTASRLHPVEGLRDE